MFYLGGNFFTGSIPAALANLINLILLSMEQNLFSGVIPPSFGNFPKLQVLSLAANELSGQIPSSIGNNSQLFQLYLQQNSLEGTIPTSIGNCRNLFLLNISENNISGAIPQEVMSLSSLSQIILSRNSLAGTLPAEVGKLTSVSTLDISENNISGEIPVTIGDCLSLEYLYMQGNSFQGVIPSQLSLLRGLQIVDLSRNNLTGEIPQELQNLPFLLYLNVSFNELQGAVPTGGVFNNSNNISLVGNSELCGGIAELHLQKCSIRTAKKRKLPAFKLAIMISCLLLLVVLCVAFLAVCWLKKSKKKPPSATEMDMGYHLRVSYRDLYQATNGFSSSNLIGSGGFGSVYKGFLNQIERPVAIKVLKLRQKIAGKSFVAETKALRNIRHRNLVKIITSCSSLDPQGNEFKALVFEFMANFSLEKWLYPDRDGESGSRHLNLLQRLNIAIDVASALHYLHDLTETTVIHRDLKPSNVLLDDDMVAHVSDFGIARLLSTTDEFAQSEASTIGIKGTIGYAAPEYGLGGTASVEGDVYSYGILVLEMFTGKRPTDEIFEQGLSIHEFVKTALQKRVMQIVDSTLLPKAEASGAETTICGNSNEIEAEEGTYNTEDKPCQLKANEQECLLSLLELGVACSAESPKDRMKMVDVVTELNLIKSSFLRS